MRKLGSFGKILILSHRFTQMNTDKNSAGRAYRSAHAVVATRKRLLANCGARAARPTTIGHDWARMMVERRWTAS